LNNQKIIDAITSSLNGYGENEKNILKKYYNDFSIKNKNLTGFLPFSIRHLGL
jgi:hypothetical protein